MSEERSKIPRHVAIIMDGNGRWAKARRRPRTEGHRAGVNATRRVVQACADRGVSVLTVFAFSSENWQRPREEVSALMELFFFALRREARQLARNGIRLRVIGDRAGFPERLQREIAAAEETTAGGERMLFQVAANYGGRLDIVHAARAVARRVAAGELAPEDIDADTLAAHLSTAGQPDPDLFIRTGGEKRISNFLLWQLAYTELYFSDVLWPDFDSDELDRAFAFYARRERRFGKISEQLLDHA